jgi:HEAT repeat protein
VSKNAGDENAAARIRASLADPDPEARRLAAQELANVDDAEGPALLILALGDSDWRVRKEAASVAQAMPRRESVVQELAQSLANKENIGLRNSVVEALVVLGRDSIDAAISALKVLDADGRKLAVEVLSGVPDDRSAIALAASLSDEDANVRAAAAEGLGNAGLASELARETAIDALRTHLSTSEMLLTLASLEALSRLDARLPWSTFEPFAKNPLFRRHAILAASRSREEAALLALVDATGDASSTVAREALLALSGWLLFASIEDDVLDRARAAMQNTARGSANIRARARDKSDTRAFSAALVALSIVHDEADVPILVEALADPDVAEHASASLELFGRSATFAIARLLPTVPQATRAVLLSLIPRLSRGAADSRPRLDSQLLSLLREGVDEAAAEVAVASVRGLAASGDESDLGRLVPIVASAEPRVALAASSALRALALRFPDATRQLLRALDPDREHAAAGCALVSALAESSPDQLSEHDFGFVERALAKGDARARRVAIDALALIGGTRAGDAVAFALADEERDVRLAAVRALGRLHRSVPLRGILSQAHDQELIGAALRALAEADPRRALEEASALLKTADTAVACAAVEAIGHADLPERDAALGEALKHSQTEVVKRAMTELARNASIAAYVRIASCLDHPSWEVRRLASELLAHVHESKVVDLLRVRLETEKEPVVRDALNAALSLPPPDRS